MTLVDMHDAVTAVIDEATAQFESDNPARLGQLIGAANTVLMAVDALFTEVPYRS